MPKYASRTAASWKLVAGAALAEPLTMLAASVRGGFGSEQVHQ